MPIRCPRAARWLKPVLLAAFGLSAFIAGAQPTNDMFANALVLPGVSGSTNGDNTLASLEPCEATNVVTAEYGGEYQTNSLWYKWTATNSGTIQLSVTPGDPSYDFILSVWTSTNAVPTMCDGSLTNLAASDSYLNGTAEVIIPLVAGTTYYVSVASYSGNPNSGLLAGPNPYLGTYVLDWAAAVPTQPSGVFRFTSTSYVVSGTDSTRPINLDGGTVDPSILGARVTVTRPGPAHGRVLVDYAVTGNNYTNSFQTNFYGTNLLSTYAVITESITTTNNYDAGGNFLSSSSFVNSSNSFVSYTNNYSTNAYILNSYLSFNGCSYQTAVVTNGFTNAASAVLEGIFATNSIGVLTPLIPAPANVPVVTNYTLSQSGFNFAYITNVYGVVSPPRITTGRTVLNGSTYSTNAITYYNLTNTFVNSILTNYYGTNISLINTPGGAALFSTNYYYTNLVIISSYSTNSIYTNGSQQISVLSSYQTTNAFASFSWSILNASYIQVSIGAPGPSTNPAPSNVPYNINVSGTTTTSASNILAGPITYTNSDGSTYTVETDIYTNTVGILTTNSFNQVVVGHPVVSASQGITLGGGTLIFNDFQMRRDIIVPVAPVVGPDFPSVVFIPSYATVTLSNARLDPSEDSDSVVAPTLDPANSTAVVSSLSTQYSPYGMGIFNFERSTFRVNRTQTNATISVNRYSGDPKTSVTVDYIIDPGPGAMAPNFGGCMPPCTYNSGRNPANTFPLQPDSDYATPNSDYTPVTGTLNWAAYDYTPKQINIPILNSGAVEFNEDLLVQLYNPLPDCTAQVPSQLGEVNWATLTILFDNTYVLGGVFPGQQPAGAVDRTWNKDNANDSTPPFLLYPGTTPGVGGTVYASATQPDGKAIIAGSFVSYDSTPYNRIVRTLPNGYQDPSFLAAPNSGANDFIAAVMLQPDGRIIIGGNFTAFNGYNRHYIARLNTDGSVDTTFNPGLGANARVWALTTDTLTGKIIMAGEFTSYNGTNINKIARLNFDGSLDTTFNPGAGPDGTVNAVAVDALGRVVIGGSFDTVDGVNNGAVARLNADGTLDTTFTPGIGTFNPETLITDSIHAVAVQPDGKVLIGGSFSYFNLVTENGLARLQPDGTLDLSFQGGTGTYNPITGVADTVYTIQLQPDNNILIGGNFTTYNQTRRVGLARVFPDGSLDTSFMDTAYNQFAGVPNQYFNPNAVSPVYPYQNTRNVIYTIALETSFLSASNLIIGGSFEQVGGGNTRDDIHPRSNVARVIGGITPGPGNIEFANPSYTVNNSDGHLYVSLVRTNSNLGIASATFTTNTAAPGPGVASGGDFALPPQYQQPTWDTAWWGSWTYATGAFGPNYALNPGIGLGATVGNPNVYISVFNPGNISGNLSANFGLSSPFDGNFSLGGEYIPLGVALGTASTAPLTIIDSNVKPGVLGFSSPVYTVIENGASTTITLTRTNGAGNVVTVWYSTSDGTGTNTVDYIGVTNQVSFAIDQTNATFTVTTRRGFSSIQPDKTVNLHLFTPSGGATLGASNATLVLVNPIYTPGHVSFSLTNYSISENAGSAVITVNRLGGSTGTMGVTVVTYDGTATNGINYTGSTNVLFWNNGDATARTITIPVHQDGVVTPNLVAYLQLINSQVNGTNSSMPLAFGGTNSTLTILNVDSAGSFQFSSAAYGVKKYGSYALIPVTRMGGSIGTVTVSFTTVDDTALQGVNYVYTTNTLVFTDGQLTRFVTVPIIPVAGTNGLTDLVLQLSNPSGLATLGSPNPAKLYIIDSDAVNETPGMPDSTYSPIAGFNDTVYALALQTNNQLVVGGDFTMANGVTRERIARLNSDGTLDAEFSLPSSTWGANGSVRAIAVQADGRILVGGFFTNFNTVARGHIARLSRDGTLDNIFNPGSGADNPVYAVAQTFVNGVPKILAAGAFASINGSTFNGVGRMEDSGVPDTTFNPGGLGANATVYAMAVQPDGKIVIGGDFTTYNGMANMNHIARLNVDGSADTNFNVGGLGASDSVRAIVVQLDGKILLGGLFTNVNGVVFNHIARLNADGTADSSFTPGIGANDAVFALGVQTDSRIVVGGEFTFCSGVTRSRITRLNPDGTVDPSINFGAGANDFVARRRHSGRHDPGLSGGGA